MESTFNESNANSSNVTEPFNITVFETVRMTIPWYYYIEATLLVVMAAIGLVVNALVMKRAVNSTSQRKQNVVLFFNLSLSDLLVFLIRVPCLIYLLLRRTTSGDDVVCKVWILSAAAVVLANFTNMTISIQRLMIIFSFEAYRKYFTIRRVVTYSILIWLILPLLCLIIYIAFQLQTTVDTTNPVCIIHTSQSELSDFGSFIARLLIAVTLGIIPISITSVSFGMLINKIYQSGLVIMDRFNDKADYSRVVGIACIRVLVLVLCWCPFLMLVILGEETLSDYSRLIRYFDYLFCAQSAVAPFITLQYSEFRETLKWRRWWSRYHDNNVHNIIKERCLRQNQQQKNSIVSSTEMKTFRQTE